MTKLRNLKLSKIAFQVDFSAKNVPRFSFVLLAAPKPKKQGGAIMAPPRVTTSFQSMGKIGLKTYDHENRFLELPRPMAGS